MLALPFVLLISAAVTALAPASAAHAYCRATTNDTAQLCPSSCDETGLPLFWKQRDIVYTFNFRGFPGVADGTMREAFRRAFASWENIACDGGETGFTFAADQGITAAAGGPLELQPDKNVVVHYSGREWNERRLPGRAYALTAVWFDKNSGEIIDVDMQFNGNMGPFTICPETGCAEGQVDLINVATHEIGHFLGLGHSDDPNAAMWCSASPSDTNKRTLAADDREGFCEIYEGRGGGAIAAEAWPADLRVHGGGGACTLATGRESALPWWLLPLVGSRWRRRRRAETRAQHDRR